MINPKYANTGSGLVPHTHVTLQSLTLLVTLTVRVL